MAFDNEPVVLKNNPFTVSIIYTKKARNIKTQGSRTKNQESWLYPLLHK
jgi:hypothetical protein